AAVDVRVADLDVLRPVVDLLVVEAVQTTRQTEAGGVLPLDGLLQRRGVHDAEHRAEALGPVEPGTGADVVADAGAPEAAFPVELLRLQQPGLAVLQG